MNSLCGIAGEPN